MSDANKFIAAIIRRPFDDAARGEFADWLDDQATERSEATPTPFAEYLRGPNPWLTGRLEVLAADVAAVAYLVLPSQVQRVDVPSAESSERNFALACFCPVREMSGFGLPSHAPVTLEFGPPQRGGDRFRLARGRCSHCGQVYCGVGV